MAGRNSFSYRTNDRYLESRPSHCYRACRFAGPRRTNCYASAELGVVRFQAAPRCCQGVGDRSACKHIFKLDQGCPNARIVGRRQLGRNSQIQGVSGRLPLPLCKTREVPTASSDRGLAFSAPQACSSSSTPVDDHITSPPMLTVSRYCMVSIWSLLNNLNLQHAFLASGLVTCDAVCIPYISSNSKNASVTRRATRVMSTLKTLGFEHSLQGCVECHWTVLIMMRS